MANYTDKKKKVNTADQEIRLQKFFTDLGIMSRRAAEAEIAAGRVRVNGQVAEIGQKIVPSRDRVVYNSKVLGADTPEEPIYVMFNKPRAVITSLSDECGRKCIKDYISGIPGRVYPVGRLDYNSDGLLLLTNDGEFANILTHPRHEIPKIYHVKVSGYVNASQLERLNKPMVIDGMKLMPAEVEVCENSENTKASPSTMLKFTLHEGKNRQIRKMCEKVNLRVLRLKRVAIGSLLLGDLPAGKWRMLTDKEVDYLVRENKKAESKNEDQ